MRIIDVHTHAFPDKLAARAIAALEAPIDWHAVGEGTVASLISSMDAAGVDVSVVCPIATKPDQAASIFEWCKSIRGERIEAFPSVHPETPDAPAWIARFAEAGFVGIKLHPMYQDFAADEPRMDAIYAAAADCGLAVEAHCGCDIAYPGDDRAAAERFGRVIRRHPRMKLVCTHLGGWKDWDAVRRHVVGTGVLMETSFSLDWLGSDGCRQIIREHGAERIMFGTDWPWASQAEQIALLNALDLTDAEKRSILYDTAARLLGRKP